MAAAAPAPAKVSERRRFERRPRKFLIKLRVLPKDLGDRVAQVLNVSQGGLLLSTKRQLPAEALVELKIPENTLGAAKNLHGKICWIKEPLDLGDYEVGLSFVKIAAGDRRRSARAPQRLLLKLRCTTPGLFYEETPRGGQLTDLSRGGCELETAHDYAPGSELEIHLPESPLGPARKLAAKVVWTRRADREGFYLIGASIR